MNEMYNHRRPAFKSESVGSDSGRGMRETTKYDDPPNSRLFIVCNKATTEEDLRSAFNRFGKVEEIWVVKDKHSGESKGVAYIKFSKTSEAALAMEEMNGRCISDNSRPIKALIAHSRDQGARRENNEEERLLRLFVMIPKTMNDSDLRDHFSKYGELDYTSVVKDRNTRENKGYGYVKYFKMSDAAKAFENCDRVFRPMFADPKPATTRSNNDGFSVTAGSSERLYGSGSSYMGSGNSDIQSSNNEEPCHRLLVVASSLVNQDQVWKLFDLVPGLDYCDVRRDNNRQGGKDQKMVVVAVYNSVSSAAYAKEKLHGFEYPPGHRLIVKYDALMPGEQPRIKVEPRLEREPVQHPNALAAAATSIQTLLSRSVPNVTGSPSGSCVSSQSTDFAHLAESMLQAASVLQSAGLQTHMPGTVGNGSVIPPMPTVNSQPPMFPAGDTYDPSYCSVRLPPPQPLAPVDAPPAERLFIVCQPQRPALFVLKDIFGRFGSLIDIYMLNGKTCGYAKYAVKECAEKAIATLHGQEICGSRLKVMLAEPQDSKETARKRFRTEEEKMGD